MKPSKILKLRECLSVSILCSRQTRLTRQTRQRLLHVRRIYTGVNADYICGRAVRVSDEDRIESQAGAPNFEEGTPQPQAIVNLSQE